MLLGPRPTGEDLDLYGKPVPQAFLVHREPGAVIAPHYHPIGQYQYVVGGSGRIGRQTVEPGSVQWADPFQPYGPLVPGEDGLCFLTLRAVSDFGANWMPAHQRDLKSVLDRSTTPMLRRNLVYELRCGDLDRESRVLHDDVDELRISVLVARPSLDLPQIGGAGAYLVVVEGYLRTDFGAAAPGDILWCTPGRPPSAVSEGGTAIVGLLQFPTQRPAGLEAEPLGQGSLVERQIP
jgi:hypothetical protein